MEGFHPSFQDYYSTRNSYKIDVDDAGVAITGHKSQDDKVCRFYLLGKRCRRGVFCPHAHPAPDQIGLHEQVIYVPSNNGDTIDASSDQYYAVEVTEIKSPICFYAQLTPCTMEQGETGGSKHVLKDPAVVQQRLELSKCMQSSCVGEIDRFGDNHSRMLSEMVAAKHSVGGEWRRGLVMDVSSNDADVQVFYVDHGDKEWLPAYRVRDLKPEFLRIPYQAHECALANVSVDTNSEAATAFFTKRVAADRALCARVAYRLGSVVYLDLLDVTNPLYDININDALVNKRLATSQNKINRQVGVSGVEPG